MAIEVATKDDADAILQIQRLAYRSEAELYQDWGIPPLKESLEELAAEFDRQTFLKAVLGDPPRIVGSVRARLQGNTCHVGRLCVHPEFQGRGIGRALMTRIEMHLPQAERFELFTGHLSKGNLRLYQSLGYVPFREQSLSSRVTFVYLQKSRPRTESTTNKSGCGAASSARTSTPE